MTYVIYHKDTTRLANTGKDSYSSERAAKAALTRALKNGWIHDKSEYAIADRDDFLSNIQKEEEITFTNPHSGETHTITQSVNTPWSCDPRSDGYWQN